MYLSKSNSDPLPPIPCDTLIVPSSQTDHFQVYIVGLVEASNFFRKESMATKILIETKWLIFVLQSSDSTYYWFEKGEWLD